MHQRQSEIKAVNSLSIWMIKLISYFDIGLTFQLDENETIRLDRVKTLKPNYDIINFSDENYLL